MTQEGTAFCANCGTPVNNKSVYYNQQRRDFQPQKDKPIKNPSVSVILSLIAVFLFLVGEAFSVLLKDGGKHFFLSFPHYIFIVPLILHLIVLFSEKLKLKIACSIASLNLSILMIFMSFSYKGVALGFFIGAILEIIASARILSYTLKIQSSKQNLEINPKIKKVLGGISIFFFIITISVAIWGSFPRVTVEERKNASLIVESVSSLPPLSYETIESWEKIIEKYEELNSNEKKLVKNRNLIIETQEKLPSLKAEKSEKDIAEVISLINGIGKVEISRLKEARVKIVEAEEKYDKLSDDEKKKITNYTQLESASKQLKDISSNLIDGKWFNERDKASSWTSSVVDSRGAYLKTDHRKFYLRNESGRDIGRVTVSIPIYYYYHFEESMAKRKELSYSNKLSLGYRDFVITDWKKGETRAVEFSFNYYGNERVNGKYAAFFFVDNISVSS